MASSDEYVSESEESVDVEQEAAVQAILEDNEALGEQETEVADVQNHSTVEATPESSKGKHKMTKAQQDHGDFASVLSNLQNEIRELKRAGHKEKDKTTTKNAKKLKISTTSARAAYSKPSCSKDTGKSSSKRHSKLSEGPDEDLVNNVQLSSANDDQQLSSAPKSQQSSARDQQLSSARKTQLGSAHDGQLSSAAKKPRLASVIV